MTDPDAPESLDPIVLAGEYALGLLDGVELADAKRRMLSDPGFAAHAAWWDEHFAGLTDAHDDGARQSPPAELWSAIDHRLVDVAPGGEVARLADRGAVTKSWNLAAIVSAAALAGVAVLLYVGSPNPGSGGPTAPATPSRQLIAQLGAGDGGSALTTRIDPVTHRMAMKASKMGVELAADMAPELWVIPVDGKPYSLGMVPADGMHERDLTREEAAMVVEGATLAVTYEPRDGAPHSAPSSAPVMAGALVMV